MYASYGSSVFFGNLPNVVPAVRLRQQPRTIDGVTYKIASHQQEREQSFRLVYDAYESSGLIEANNYQMHVTKWHLAPTTDIFIALHEGEIIYTMTLISDDSLGLPMYSIYQDELDALRATGIYVAEVSCLASRQDHFSRSKRFSVFTQLVGLMFQYARRNDVEQLVIAVHPRHFRFYNRFLGFEQIGDVKPYSAVRDNPAVACSHNFAQLDLDRYKLFDHVHETRFDRHELLRHPMLPEEREQLRRVVKPDNRPMLVGVA